MVGRLSPEVELDRGPSPAMIYLCVRRTLDWSDERAFWAQIDERDRRGVEVWNRTFNVPFHLFRRRVREIAAQNHACVADVAHENWDAIPDGSLVLPVDDDDWFAPDIARHLVPHLDADAIGCRWRCTWVEVPLNTAHRLRLLAHRWLGAPLKFFCTTNNYALFKRPGTRQLLHNHSKASEWFSERLRQPDGGGIRLLDARLSIANRTLGSATVLRQIERPGQLLRRFEAYRRLYRRDAGADLAWAGPYVAMMAALMDELEPTGASRGSIREGRQSVGAGGLIRSGRTRGPRAQPDGGRSDGRVGQREEASRRRAREANE
jgi:hypothetical protein